MAKKLAPIITQIKGMESLDAFNQAVPVIDAIKSQIAEVAAVRRTAARVLLHTYTKQELADTTGLTRARIQQIAEG